MLCRAYTVLTGSDSASFKIAMICSSVNRLRFISFCLSFFAQNSTFATSSFLGSGHLDPTRLAIFSLYTAIAFVFRAITSFVFASPWQVRQ